MKVSIPSSRVGTNARRAQGVVNAFVSIPSSRVGTGEGVRAKFAWRLFPSPQVGSEPPRSKQNGTPLCGFHPLKSGRNLVAVFNYDEAKLVSIPSSRVGTSTIFRSNFGSCAKFPSPQVGSEPAPRRRNASLTNLGFHPLKSGRNLLPL